ncbi:AAA family ATPase [Rummeliibacillus sp. JY-2-4R]
MYIRRLVIYGFGQHEEITVDLSKGINVFYGLNEAGKTTIQQFILQILFGFPLKNQQLLRYEPKKGSKFGGQVHITDKEFGDCVIERVKGKAAGDVTVYLSNGEKGHEELLNKLLRSYNRQGFESVFSFSVHQLQQMENLSEEELTRVLLASGTTGADQLSDVNQQLERRQQELFKKSGKVPLLNQQITNLVSLDHLIKEERNKIDKFEPSMKRINDIQCELVQLNQQEQQLEKNIQQLNAFRQLSPLLDEKRKLQSHLSAITCTSFPANGVNRYEQLLDRKLTNEAALKKVQQDYERLLSNLRLEFDESRLNTLKELVDLDGEWREWQIQIRQLDREIQTLQQEVATQFQLLGLNNVEQQQAVIQADASLQQDDQFQRMLNELQEQEEHCRFQQRTADRLQEEMQLLSSKLDELYEGKPTKSDQERLNNWHKEKEEAVEAKVIMQHQSEKGHVQFARIISILLLAISVIVGTMQKNIMIAIVGIVAAAIIILLFGRQTKQGKEINKREELERKLKHLQTQNGEMEKLEQFIRQYNDRVALVEQQLEDKEQEQQQVYKTLSKYQTQANQFRDRLNLFLAKFQINGDYQPKLLQELFRNVRGVQQTYSSLQLKRKQRAKLEEFSDERLQQASKACKRACTTENLSTFVGQSYQQMLEQQQILVSSIERKKQLQEQLDELRLLDETYQNELLKLLEEAKVETVEAFYEADAQYRQFMQLTYELQQIDVQLKAFDEVVLTIDGTIQEADSRINEYKKAEIQIRQKKDALLKEQATLHVETEHLLQDQQYRNQLQQFEQQKALLNQNAKEWVITKLISNAIQDTLHQLKEEKLPAVLIQSESYFKILTNNQYESLYLNTEGRFEALSADGIRYSVAELSQATKEQAYIALRFALANSLKQSAPFPIIMDDPFVHFDRLRCSYMVQLIQSTSDEHQILYFTCHEDMIKQWETANIIHVAELKNERGITSV